MKSKKKLLINLTVVLALAVVGAAVWFMIATPEKRLIKKIEGEYKYTDIVAVSDNGNAIFNNPVYDNASATRWFSRIKENVHISKEYVAFEDVVANADSSPLRVYVKPKLKYYKTSSDRLDETIKDELVALQKSLPDIDVNKGECLIAKENGISDVFLIYGDDIYLRSQIIGAESKTENHFYIKAEKVDENLMTAAEKELFNKLKGEYRVADSVAFSRSYSDKENFQEEIHSSYVYRNGIHLDKDIVTFPFVLPDTPNETRVIDLPYFTYHKLGEEDFEKTLGTDLAPFKEYVEGHYEKSVNLYECECLAVWDKEQIRKLGVMDSLCAFFISVDDDVYLFSAGNFLKLERTDATEISEETKALVNKMKGEYKPVKALAFCAPDNVPYSGTVKVPKEVDKNIRIVIDEDYVAGTGMLYSSAEYHAYNTSDESLREIIGMDLGVLQYELDDIDVKNGECLVVYDCNSQVRKLPQFFLLYDDEVYTRLGYYYVKLKKIN